MKVTRFDPTDSLIIIVARIVGPVIVSGGMATEPMAASVDLETLLGFEVEVKGTVAFRPSGRERFSQQR